MAIRKFPGSVYKLEEENTVSWFLMHDSLLAFCTSDKDWLSAAVCMLAKDKVEALFCHVTHHKNHKCSSLMGETVDL